jgi:hypothetical protein
MNNRNVFLLSHIAPNDVESLLHKIEGSFKIKFEPSELKGVKTFGHLCDAIHHKLKHEHADTCTTQHAFYMLRNAITTAKGIDRNAITTQTCLNDIFFEDDRLWLLTVIEQELDMKLNILKIKDSVLKALFIGFAVSLVTLFFNWQAALVIMGLCTVAALFAGRFGKELRVKTLGQLAEKVAREHYITCKRNAATASRNEIIRKVQELFQHEYELDTAVLTPQATFN